jgi:SAM-dependent methyltransferase
MTQPHQSGRTVQPVARRALSDAKRRAGRVYRRGQDAVTRLLFERGMTSGTSGHMDLDDVGLGHPERRGYEPSTWFDLWRVLRTTRVRPGDVLLDVGCGKGRVLCVAARRPFARVEGVEISGELAEAARANLAGLGRRTRAHRTLVVTADATEYVVPDDVTHIYLFNSFGGEILRTVMGNIRASLARRPRRVRLYYSNPLFEEAILEGGAFRRVRVRRGLRRDLPGRTIIEYVHEPGG